MIIINVPEILLAAFVVVVAVVSLLSNASVLLCFTQSAEIRSHVPGVFVLNLSFSNILLAVINMPATFLGVVAMGKAGDNNDKPPFGNAFCQGVSFAETLLTTNAMLSMAALSMDRWIAMVFPLSYSSKMRWRDAFLMVAYSLLHSMTFALAQVSMSWGGYSRTYASCTVHLDRGGGGDGGGGESERWRFAAFTLVFHATSFGLCLLVMCVSYLKVLRVARSHCKRIDVITVQTLLLLVDIHPSVKERCLVEQKQRRQRATKKVCIFIGSFILCFAPYTLTRLVELLPHHMPIHRYWGVATKCAFYAKAASDPFVYSLLRQPYWNVLTGVRNKILRRDSCSSTTSTLDTTTTVDDSAVVATMA